MAFFTFFASILGFIALFLSVNAVLENCGRSKVASLLTPTSVFGNAKESAWPWMVAITIMDRRTEKILPICGGFLIDLKHVLTAAHCIDDKKLNMYQLHIGSVDVSQAQVYKIKNIVTNKGYRRHIYYNDIAVLTLDKPVENPDINPICLPDEEIKELDLRTMKATVAGWGNGDSVLLKQQKNMEILINQECEREFGRCVSQKTFGRQFSRGLTSDFLCAKYPIKRGEKPKLFSGSPLMLQKNGQWYAVGFVAFGCPNPEVPDGFINLHHYLNWIRKNTED